MCSGKIERTGIAALYRQRLCFLEEIEAEAALKRRQNDGYGAVFREKTVPHSGVGNVIELGYDIPYAFSGLLADIVILAV